MKTLDFLPIKLYDDLIQDPDRLPDKSDNNNPQR